MIGERITNRLSEATVTVSLPQAEAWGFDIITALRAEGIYFLKLEA